MKNKLMKTILGILILLGMYLYINKDIFFNAETAYSKEALNYAEKIEFKSTLLKNDFNQLINDLLEDNSFDKTLIDEYQEIDYKNNDDFLLNINSLLEKGYNAEEINLIYSDLTNDEIVLLKEENYTDILNNYLEYPYFMVSYLDRYISYKNKNDFDLDKVITYVNADLDKEFYQKDAIKIIENPNDNLVLVNKFNKLDENYSPALVTLSKSYSTKSLQVKNDVKIAFEKMCDDARKEDLDILAASTYRTYSYQEGLYENYAASDGYEAADTYSARPGHSEHHTGLAIDVTTEEIGFGINSSFKETDEYKWIYDNAHLYGFIIRYPEGKENITGYMAESWHLRFLSVDVATYIYENDITFDEYYAKFLLKK